MGEKKLGRFVFVADLNRRFGILNQSLVRKLHSLPIELHTFSWVLFVSFFLNCGEMHRIFLSSILFLPSLPLSLSVCMWMYWTGVTRSGVVEENAHSVIDPLYMFSLFCVLFFWIGSKWPVKAVAEALVAVFKSLEMWIFRTICLIYTVVVSISISLTLLWLPIVVCVCCCHNICVIVISSSSRSIGYCVVGTFFPSSSSSYFYNLLPLLFLIVLNIYIQNSSELLRLP